VEGTVHLRVETKSEDGVDYILLQVTDTGGGIPAEDMPRVFTRLYRADNVLIQGVGDTGVGLSIAKTLTEAQKGRIWVESDMGKGSTFSVLLPISGRLEKEKQR
jgi:signal transduction histidine kinase